MLSFHSSAAIVGLTIFALAAPPAEAMTNIAPAGLVAAVDDLSIVEPVHCRRYLHKHRYGHRWSRGCRVGVVVVAPERRRVIVRERGTTVRTGVTTTIRSGTTVRSGTGATTGKTTIRSGRESGTTTDIKAKTQTPTGSATGTDVKGGASTPKTTPAPAAPKQ